MPHARMIVHKHLEKRKMSIFFSMLDKIKFKNLKNRNSKI